MTISLCMYKCKDSCGLLSKNDSLLQGDLGSHSTWEKLDYVLICLNNEGGSGKNPYRILV